MRTAMREMAGVFSGLERRLIVKRLKDGRKAKADEGGHAVGAYPYGYTRGQDGRAVPHPQESQGLALMLELAGAGESTRTIATRLAADGYPTKRGGRWTSPTVAQILKRHNERTAA